MDISFLVNLYDQNGDIIEEGIYLFVDNTSIKVGRSFNEFKDFLNRLNKMLPEIEKNSKLVRL